MVDTSKIQTDWQARGFSFGVWTDAPGQVWVDYRHNEDELFMVIEGEVELEMKGKKTKPAIGEEVLIPKGVLHSVRNLGQGQSRWLYGYKK